MTRQLPQQMIFFLNAHEVPFLMDSLLDQLDLVYLLHQETVLLVPSLVLPSALYLALKILHVTVLLNTPDRSQGPSREDERCLREDNEKSIKTIVLKNCFCETSPGKLTNDKQKFLQHHKLMTVKNNVLGSKPHCQFFVNVGLICFHLYLCSCRNLTR